MATIKAYFHTMIKPGHGTGEEIWEVAIEAPDNVTRDDPRVMLTLMDKEKEIVEKVLKIECISEPVAKAISKRLAQPRKE